MKFFKIVCWVFLGLAILALSLCLPYWVTQVVNEKYNFGLTEANDIADVIGGILGPFFSFLGSCLVAITIWLQIKQRNDDSNRYEADKLRLENEAKVLKQKDFEKVIFENCLENLKRAELKIFELNALDKTDKFASNLFFEDYFHFKFTSKTLIVHLFMDELNSSIQLFNELKITTKAYQIIFIQKIDRILDLTRSNILGKWNTIKDVFDFENQVNIPANQKRLFDTKHFFRYSRFEQFREVLNFYSNIWTLKKYYSDNFDDSFQEKEIEQLTETKAWLESIKDELERFVQKKEKFDQEAFEESFTHEKSVEFKQTKLEVENILLEKGFSAEEIKKMI